MIKKIFIVLIILIISCLQLTYASIDVKIYLNGKQLVSEDVSPFIEDDFTLVPIRMIMEAFDYNVDWDSYKRIVIIKSSDKTITVTPDSNIADIDNKKITMDKNAKIVDNYVYVPLRFISENFGYKVDWENSTRSVMITEKKEELIAIKKISSSRTENKITVTIEADKEFSEPETMTIYNPNRFVIDIKDAVLEAGENELTVLSTVVAGIRFSQFNLDPNIVRVVLDLNTDTTVRTNISEKTYTIEVNDALPIKREPGEKLVVIDPGHGGNEPGSNGIYEDEKILEKDVNLYIGQKVYELLKKDGINVISTRLTDKTVSLQDRVEIANNAKADLFVSIHNNAFDNPAAQGTLTLYAYDDPKDGSTVSDKQVAEIMQKELIKGTGGYDRKLLKNPNIYVTKNVKMPALLCECLFMTNEEDIKVLADNKNLDKIAQSIADGIKNCLEILP